MESIREQLIDLYLRYNFSIDKDLENIFVFTYCDGYFYNAEIVISGDVDTRKIEEIKDEYQSLGYAVREITYHSIERLHEQLFNGFFNVKTSQKRLQQEYLNFQELQKKKMFDIDYQYVEPNYFLESNYHEKHLIDNIKQQLTQLGAHLIIIEAAAGFGKTCTSYELMNCLSGQESKTLIFTELSKNRKAALFRYVLLDEIDQKYTNLSSELVLWEIKNGRVPLIIDGFDELLSKSTTEGNSHDNNENAQTMLDTIAELFDEGSAAKVILTSRKSSILTGKEFDDWAKDKLQGCCVTRISIESPSVKDWIGHEKQEFLENHDIPMESITNPILLSYMRYLDLEQFKKEFKNTKSVVECYFRFLLSRERERQALLLSVEEQYEIMTEFAKMMVEMDIKADEFSFIRDIFAEIMHEQFPVYRERYIQLEDRLDEESFAAKLARHALLNRVSATKNMVGFINDFIFGIFIGEAIIKGIVEPMKINRQYIDISATAMVAKGYADKITYYKKIKSVLGHMNYEQQLDIELRLLGTIDHNYENQYISNYNFGDTVVLVGCYRFQNCTFQNCTFERCLISTSLFDGCTFINCKFYDVLIDKDTVENCRLIFYGDCVGHEDFVMAAEGTCSADNQEKDYEVEVLNRFRKGRALGQMRIQDLLIKSATAEQRDKLLLALESLKRKNYISKDGHYWILNRDYIIEIKEMLGMNK